MTTLLLHLNFNGFVLHYLPYVKEADAVAVVVSDTVATVLEGCDVAML